MYLETDPCHEFDALVFIRGGQLRGESILEERPYHRHLSCKCVNPVRHIVYEVFCNVIG